MCPTSVAPEHSFNSSSSGKCCVWFLVVLMAKVCRDVSLVLHRFVVFLASVRDHLGFGCGGIPPDTFLYLVQWFGPIPRSFGPSPTHVSNKRVVVVALQIHEGFLVCSSSNGKCCVCVVSRGLEKSVVMALKIASFRCIHCKCTRPFVVSGVHQTLFLVSSVQYNPWFFGPNPY